MCSSHTKTLVFSGGRPSTPPNHLCHPRCSMLFRWGTAVWAPTATHERRQSCGDLRSQQPRSRCALLRVLAHVFAQKYIKGQIHEGSDWWIPGCASRPWLHFCCAAAKPWAFYRIYTQSLKKKRAKVPPSHLKLTQLPPLSTSRPRIRAPGSAQGRLGDRGPLSLCPNAHPGPSCKGHDPPHFIGETCPDTPWDWHIYIH